MVGDSAHAYATYMVLSDEAPFDSVGWNDKVWLNMFGSLARGVLRLLTLLGFFGSVSAEEDTKDGEKKSA